MNLPRQYSYNPRLRLIVFSFGSGVAWIALQGFLCGCKPHMASLSFGFVPIMLGLLLTVRRLIFKRCLILDRDALELPTGFLRLRNTRIPYTSIERIWQAQLFGVAVLCVATKEGKVEIPSGMLPDADAYIAVRSFLDSLERQFE